MAKRASQEPFSDQQQPYDNLLKSVFEGQEKQMLPYFLPGAEYLATLNVEVIRPPLRVDRVYRVRYKGKRTIVHLEFESGSNNGMADRLKVKTLPRNEKREISGATEYVGRLNGT